MSFELPTPANDNEAFPAFGPETQVLLDRLDEATKEANEVLSAPEADRGTLADAYVEKWGKPRAKYAAMAEDKYALGVEDRLAQLQNDSEEHRSLKEALYTLHDLFDQVVELT